MSNANLLSRTTTGGGAVDSVNGQTGVVVLDTGDVSSVVDSRYVTDAQLTVIGNTSGTNTGDQDLSGLVPYTGATGNVDLGANTLIATDLQTALVTSAEFNHLAGLGQNVQDTLNNLFNNFSSYVPYAGASTNVDLGANTIAASNLSGTNTGDQTSIVGITGTKAEFDTAVTDGNILFNDEQGIGFRFENRTSDPGTPTVGQVWLRTDL